MEQGERSDDRFHNKQALGTNTSDVEENEALLSARKASSLQTESAVEVKNVEGLWSRGSKPVLQVYISYQRVVLQSTASGVADAAAMKPSVAGCNISAY